MKDLDKNVPTPNVARTNPYTGDGIVLPVTTKEKYQKILKLAVVLGLLLLRFGVLGRVLSSYRGPIGFLLCCPGRFAAV